MARTHRPEEREGICIAEMMRSVTRTLVLTPPMSNKRRSVKSACGGMIGDGGAAVWNVKMASLGMRNVNGVCMYVCAACILSRSTAIFLHTCTSSLDIPTPQSMTALEFSQNALTVGVFADKIAPHLKAPDACYGYI